jgi:hypothetical protein
MITIHNRLLVVVTGMVALGFVIYLRTSNETFEYAGVKRLSSPYLDLAFLALILFVSSAITHVGASFISSDRINFSNVVNLLVLVILGYAVFQTTIPGKICAK